MIKSSHLYCFLLGLILFSSCKNEIIENPDRNLNLEFAPVEIGKYWEYQNDSIIFDMGGNLVDTTRSYSKEVIADHYVDQAGDTIHRIERFFKRELTDNWVLSDVWTCQKTNSQFIRTEENIKFLKLVFPATEGQTWDGNRFFDENQNITVAGEEIMAYRYWNYSIEEADVTSFGGINYDEVIKVNHIFSEDAYEYRESFEHYAKNVGLVQRRQVAMDAQCEPNCIGTEFTDWAEQGFILDQILIASN